MTENFQSSSFIFAIRTKAARTGAGIGLPAPRTERHITSLSSRSSAASSLAKFILSDSSPPHAVLTLRALRSTFAGRALYGRASALAWKQLYIGAAAASNWDMGCSPRISSIVLSMLLVEYIVETTAPRLVYGLITYA